MAVCATDEAPLTGPEVRFGAVRRFLSKLGDRIKRIWRNLEFGQIPLLALHSLNDLIVRKFDDARVRVERNRAYARNIDRPWKSNSHQSGELERSVRFAVVERVMALDPRAGGNEQFAVLEFLLEYEVPAGLSANALVL